jgi:hypothetical protein
MRERSVSDQEEIFSMDDGSMGDDLNDTSSMDNGSMDGGSMTFPCFISDANLLSRIRSDFLTACHKV